MKNSSPFTILTFVIIISFLSIVVSLFYGVWAKHRIDDLEKRWEGSAQTESGIDMRRATWLCKDRVDSTLISFFDVPDSLADSVWREWFDKDSMSSAIIDSNTTDKFIFKATELVSDVIKGFWAYWTPRIKASGDTFVVLMADSLWMTGDKPKTTRVSWCGWKPWGLWFYVR